VRHAGVQITMGRGVQKTGGNQRRDAMITVARGV
jgi:hypothetical protein